MAGAGVQGRMGSTALCLLPQKTPYTLMSHLSFTPSKPWGEAYPTHTADLNPAKSGVAHVIGPVIPSSFI